MAFTFVSSVVISKSFEMNYHGIVSSITDNDYADPDLSPGHDSQLMTKPRVKL